MNVEQQANLQADVERGQRAQHVLDIYLEDFFNKIDKELYDAFLASPLQEEALIEIKQLSMAIEALKNRVVADIDGGKIALKQLSETTKH